MVYDSYAESSYLNFHTDLSLFEYNSMRLAKNYLFE